MKLYIVVTCIEREMHLVGIAKTLSDAQKIMQSDFIDYHSTFFDNTELQTLCKHMLTERKDDSHEWEFRETSAWSNVDKDYQYDCKIFTIDTETMQGE